MPRIALVTCADMPGGDPEDASLLAGACAEVGMDAEWVVWDDPAVDWSVYDLSVVRATWDYTQRLEEFMAWVRRVPRLVNPADVIAWNTTKTYLRELAEAGIPVVPTQWLDPGDPGGSADRVALPEAGEYVVKPAVGAGGRDSARYAAGDGGDAREHVAWLHERGFVVMVQPYMSSVDERGETAMVFIDGEFSHAFRKDAPLSNDPLDMALYRQEILAAREPSAAEHDVAGKALAAVPGGADRLLYARVDLVNGPDGEPVLLELELTEPGLFLNTDAQAPARFAAALDRWAGR